MRARAHHDMAYAVGYEQGGEDVDLGDVAVHVCWLLVGVWLAPLNVVCVAVISRCSKLVGMNWCSISFAFAHLFSPWQSSSKLNSAHLA